MRRRIARLEREIHAHIGRPSWRERLQAVAAAGLALWTALTLKLELFQHPKLVKHTYRLPAEAPRPSRAWRELTRLPQLVSVELRSERTIWVRLQGTLKAEQASTLAEKLREALHSTRDRLVLDLKRLTHFEGEADLRLAETLRDYSERIRILAPSAMSHPGLGAVLTLFSLYHGPRIGV